MRARLPSLLAVAGLLLTACTGSSPEPSPSPSIPPAQQMQAEVASVDLYAGAPQRVEVGLFLGDGRFVTFGQVAFAFAYEGTAASPASPTPGPQVTAAYLPTPGTPGGEGEGPVLSQPTDARGVYQAEDVTFPDAGIWQVRVIADIQSSGTQTATATFQVAEQPAYPAPGQPAMPTENLTMSSTGVPKAAIDSRFTIKGTIPDPQLHRTTIAKALAEHRPVVAVFSTPVYCISRFCGPVTAMIQRLANTYADRAAFVHVEIWRDFTKQVVNQAAADWVYRDGDITEPWVFLIGADGTILDRWNSLLDPRELESELRQLPGPGGATPSLSPSPSA